VTAGPPTPDAILQLGFAFWGAKALLSAVELGVFTTLAQRPRTAHALQADLGLQPRGTTDWLDASTATPWPSDPSPRDLQRSVTLASMRLYHATYSGEDLLAHGFGERGAYFAATIEGTRDHRGGRRTHLLVVDVPDEIAEQYRYRLPDGRPVDEFIFPAEIINLYRAWFSLVPHEAAA